jgi:hypothetical protein
VTDLPPGRKTTDLVAINLPDQGRAFGHKRATGSALQRERKMKYAAATMHNAAQR